MEDNHKICRICLENHNTLFSLHGRIRGVSPYDKLNKINISIELDQADKSCICLQCLSDLDTAVHFFEKCKRANEIIATRISQRSHVQVPIAGKCKDVLDFNNLDTNLELHNETVPEPEIEAKDLFSNTKAIGIEEKQKCLHCGSKSRCRHRAPAKKHTCQYCQKVFSRKFNFKLHLKRHVGERDWPCPSCGVQQITRSLAERHCAVKSRKPCPFSGCGKSFTTITNLNTHIRVHNGEKPFKCDVCGKGFASKTRLGDHVRIHTGEKPYICPVCGKQFTTNRLTVHMWTHAEASSRPYACHKTGCAKRFSTKTALQLHARVHGRPARAHACSLCDAAYNHRQSLNKHIKKHHRQKSPEPPDSANRHSDHSACHTL